MFTGYYRQNDVFLKPGEEFPNIWKLSSSDGKSAAINGEHTAGKG
jgi:hypothetical protein